MEVKKPQTGVLVVSVIIAIVLQLVVAPVITILGVVPNFVLAATIIIAMHNSPVRSTIAGFLMGLIFDFCSLGPIGAMTFILTLLAYIVSSLNKGSFASGFFQDFIILILAVALGELLVSVIYAVAGVNPEFLLSLVQRVLPAIAYDTIIGCILILIYNVTQKGSSRNSSHATTGRSLSRKLRR